MIRTNTTRLKDALPHLRVVLLSSRGEAEGMESARDADADGLPDEWEFHWFGTLAFSPDCLDAYGNTFLYDYQNGYDPNVLEFSIEATNNYVRTASPTLQLDIIAGIPFYQAVLVDNTNLAAASWTAYSSSNLTLNLGSTEGWHEIWIGLKGLPDEASKTWVWKRLKLDRTAPLLVITNPVVTTVQQPMIELQGYSPEEIARISYDLTNAAGLFTSQPVLVLDRHYDTNTWEFTTNTFQAFDIPLTNGLNTFTLHATDLAGNTTNLILNYTLDYTGKPAPALQLYWPQDGTRICGSRFTWRGRVDDFTAQLTAQIVDANGNTNLVPVLVERDGNWWAENLPLSGGTNELTLTATDVAGNVVTTNISIIQSPLQLIMNDVPGDQLWNPTVNVTGAISDPADYTVWVNGVKARMDGSGAWEADQVPTTPGGTAVFEVRAIPNTDNGGNGTGGSGGNSASYADPGNPHSADARDTQSQTDKPMRLYVESYSYSEYAEVHPSGSGYNNNNVQTYSFQVDDAETWSLNWADGQGGSGSHNYQGSSSTFSTTGILPNESDSVTLNEQDQWPASAWPDLVDGSETYTAANNGTPSSGSAEIGPPHVNGSDYSYEWPTMAFEHCQKHDSDSGSATEYDQSSGGYNTAQDNVVWTRTADTVMKLFTGGKAGSGRQNLFVLSASARRPLWTGAKLNLLTGWDYWEWELPPQMGPWTNIDPRQITIAGQALDTNGTAYFAWPDGVTKDVTPRTGYDYYTFAQPSVGKYTLVHHVDCVAAGDTNLDRTTLGIGEVVHLSGMPDNTIWSISGGGRILSTSGSDTTYIAPLRPTSATITATVGTAQLSVGFSVIPPNSIIVDSHTDAPAELGTEDANGTQMGARTYYYIEIGPNTVSFDMVSFRENLSPLTVTWPNRTTTPIMVIGRTNSISFPCGSRAEDNITAGLRPIDLLFNGTNYEDFSYDYTWHDQYQNDAGEWVDFVTVNRRTVYHGNDKKCQVTYQGVSGSWQGPFN